MSTSNHWALIIPSSARGNTSLESAVSLTKSLRWDIQALGQRLGAAANEELLVRQGSSKAQSKAQNELELKRVLQDLRKLLSCIEDAVPLINLAITTSGASLSTTLPSTISPSRLLQASTFLTAGDTQYSMTAPNSGIQVGPTFTLSLYMLFSGHLRPQNEDDVRRSTWKEVIHKTRVKLIRVPLNTIYDLPADREKSSLPNGPSVPSIEADSKADEFAYQLVMIEDLDDDRMHTYEEIDVQPGPYNGVEMAGIREVIPVHEISKIFYADTGKILNIGGDGEPNNPVLLLKRDLNATPPRRMMERFREETDEDNASQPAKSISAPDNEHCRSQSQIDAQLNNEHNQFSLISVQSPGGTPVPDPWRIPPNVDPEWLAFEVYTESEESDAESEAGASSQGNPPQSSRAQSLDPHMAAALTNLHLNEASSPSSNRSQQPFQPSSSRNTLPGLPPIRTSLSLLETLLRLLSLQQFQQTSHLSIPDEFLNFFLSESATTGAANGDEQERRRLRNEARQRVGFDPYDESPIKRRGEEYQYRNGEEGYNDQNYLSSPGRPQSYNDYDSPRYDEGYETRQLYTPSHHHYYSYPSREVTPETPPLLLKDRAYSSRSNTPDRPGLPRPVNSNRTRSAYASPETPSGGMMRKGRQERIRVEEGRSSAGEGGRKGSRLAPVGIARIVHSVKDEGLGTSPKSSEKGEEKWGLDMEGDEDFWMCPTYSFVCLLAFLPAWPDGKLDWSVDTPLKCYFWHLASPFYLILDNGSHSTLLSRR